MNMPSDDVPMRAPDPVEWVGAFQQRFSLAASSLSTSSLEAFVGFYDKDAAFVDPFAELCGRAQIQASYLSMLTNLHQARFTCRDWAMAPRGRAGTIRMVLTWDFHFQVRPTSQNVCIPGASWLELDPTSRLVTLHRDYWDASELLAAFPGLGWLIRGVKKRIAAASHVMEKS
jgi:steroid delta-isomerase